MKLRIQGNSLRLRLKRSEVALFAESGVVEECIEIGSAALRYRLERGDVDTLSAHLEAGLIRVVVPDTLAREWTDSARVGIDSADGTPSILIEKDFKCAHGTEAEEADSFPNPLESTLS